MTKQKLTQIERAFVRYQRNAKGLSNKDVALVLGCSESMVRSVLNGNRTISDQEKNALMTYVIPTLYDPTDYFYSPWCNKLPFGKKNDEKEEVRSGVVFDGIKLSGKVVNSKKLLKYFDNLFSNKKTFYEFFIATKHGPLKFVLHKSKEPYSKRSIRNYELIINIGVEIKINGVSWYDLVARLYVGATRARCPEHKWRLSHHKRSGAFKDCLIEKNGGKCPSDHYVYKPIIRRCGKCLYPDTEYQKCLDCRTLTHGLNCHECNRLSLARPDLRIDISGAGCRHNLLVPLVKNLFTPFVIPETVVREHVEIALDIDLPYLSILPFQKNISIGPYWRPFRKVTIASDFENAPTLYIGSRVKAYDKGAEIKYRCNVEMDRTVMPPDHMRGWDPESGTRLEFENGDDRKSLPGQAHDLSNLRKDWLTFALADLRQVPPESIESYLVTDAKRFGYVNHEPSRERLRDKLARRENPPPKPQGKPGSDKGAIDMWLTRQGKAKDAVSVTKMLGEVLYEELLRIEHPFDVGEAVEKALPRLQSQLKNALAHDFKIRNANPIDYGQPIDRVRGIVTWLSNSELKKLDRLWEASLV
jgi:transcriptional regulator with XRE-family HTH domain